jgi:DNA-binding NtrC family response regulator
LASRRTRNQFATKFQCVHFFVATPVIFITGGAFTTRAREYLSKEDNITLEKPFDVTSFRKLVKDRVIMAKGMMASRTETGSSGSTVRGSGGSGP